MKQNPQQVSLSSIAINTQAEQEQLSIYLSFLLSLATKCEGKANESAITCGCFDRSTTTTKWRFQQELAACKRRLIQAIVFIIILFFFCWLKNPSFRIAWQGYEEGTKQDGGCYRISLLEITCLWSGYERVLSFGGRHYLWILIQSRDGRRLTGRRIDEEMRGKKQINNRIYQLSNH